MLVFLHPPGNVLDSRGAQAFLLTCIVAIREILPQVRLEVRMDSAFFSDEIVTLTISMSPWLQTRLLQCLASLRQAA